VAGLPPSPSRPILRARYDHRQQEVIAAAAREFADRGFHATSMQDLVTATGLTAGGLYHYIEGKDQLLVLICDELMQPLLIRVREITDSALSPLAQLREIVREWMLVVDAKRDHVLVFQQERVILESGEQWEHIRQQRHDFEELLARVLEAGEQEGIFDFADRDLALRALLGMVNHTATWFRDDGRLTAIEIADGYVSLLLG
jgi:TetR/AcrR family transcriptional regulator, cholesterol catabolism regulator